MSNKDRLLKFIKKCHKQRHIPDLHSFAIGIANGKAFVECENPDIWVEAITFENGQEYRDLFRGDAAGATEFLMKKNCDLSTVEQ